MWNQFSISVKNRSSEISAIEPSHYAEKVSMNLAQRISDTLLISKNIYIVRDPRAELVSIIKFNKKRRFNGFGWKDNDTPLTFAKRMVESRTLYLRHVSEIRNKNTERNIVFRYEDLMLDPYTQTNKIEEFLGLHLDYDMVLNQKSKLSHHITTTSVNESVSGWVDFLNEDVKKIFTKKMKKELDLFDY
jgi:hypothetical protein